MIYVHNQNLFSIVLDGDYLVTNNKNKLIKCKIIIFLYNLMRNVLWDIYKVLILNDFLVDNI